MPIKTVRAHSEIIRRVGLGAQQCAECGQVYRDTNIPETCDNGECPTNTEHQHDPSRCTWAAGVWRCPTAEDLRLERLASCSVKYCYHLTEGQGRAIQQYLLNYAEHSEREGGLGWRIREMAKLFD